MKNKIGMVLWLLSLLMLEATSQVTLDYNSFLQRVKENNPLAEKALNNSRIAKAQYKSALGNYDPMLSGVIENKFFDNKNYYTLGTAEIKQPIFASNYLKAGYNYGQGTNLNPENKMPLAGQAFLGIETSVLQGLLFDKRRAELLKAGYYKEYYSLEEKIQLNDLLYHSSKSYLEYLNVAKQKQLYGYFADLAMQRLKGIEALANLGEKASIDTVEAAIFLQTRLLEKQYSEASLIKEYNDLMVFYENKNKERFQKPMMVDSLDVLYTLFSKRSLIEISKSTTNPILEQYTAKQGVLETEARFKKELIKPTLNVSYNFLNPNTSNAFTTFNTNNYKWGATFAFPLFLRKPRFDYKIANIASLNNSLELTNTQNKLNYKQKYLIEALTITQQQINNAKRAASYSKILVEAERLKFQNGESSLFLLNTREGKWLESELKLLENKTNYIKLLIDLIYINGSLDYTL